MAKKNKFFSIKSIEQLQDMATEGLDCFILLNGGLRSSKHIWFDNGYFEIINLIDDTTVRLTKEQLSLIGELTEAPSNIAIAIKNNRLWTYATGKNRKHEHTTSS